MSVPAVKTTGDGGGGGGRRMMCEIERCAQLVLLYDYGHTQYYIIFYVPTCYVHAAAPGRASVYERPCERVWASRPACIVSNTILYYIQLWVYRIGVYNNINNMSRYIILLLYRCVVEYIIHIYVCVRFVAGEQRAVASCRFGCLNYHFGVLRQRARQRIRIKVGFYSFVCFSLSSLYIYNIIIYLPAQKVTGWAGGHCVPPPPQSHDGNDPTTCIYLHRPSGIYIVGVHG